MLKVVVVFLCTGKASHRYSLALGLISKSPRSLMRWQRQHTVKHREHLHHYDVILACTCMYMRVLLAGTCTCCDIHVQILHYMYTYAHMCITVSNPCTLYYSTDHKQLIAHLRITREGGVSAHEWSMQHS